MKKLWQNFFAPTPAHVRKWQKVTAICGVLAMAISMGGAKYDFVPEWFVHLLGWGTLAGVVLMQFSTDSSTQNKED